MQAQSDIAVIVVLYLFGIFWYYMQAKKNAQIDKDNATTQDFAVEIKAPEGASADPDDYKRFFSKFGTVVKVVVHMNNGKILKALGDRKIFHRQREYAFIAAGRPSGLSPQHPDGDKAYSKWHTKLLAAQKNLDELADDEVTGRSVSRIFIIFNTETAQRMCLRSYTATDENRDGTTGGMGRRFICNGRGAYTPPQGRENNPQDEQIYNMYVTEASEPSDVIWEDLEVGACGQFISQVKSVALTFLLVLFLIGCLMGLKTQGAVFDGAKSYISDIVSQKFLASNYTEKNHTLSSWNSQKCRTPAKVAEETDLDTNKTFDTIMSTLAATFISLLNMILPMIMKKLCNVEKHARKSTFQISMMFKLTAVRFCNTAIVTFVVTRNCKMLSMVGVKAIMIVLLFDLLLNQTLRFIDIYNHFFRYFIAGKALTKEKLYTYWRGTYWNLGERFTDILKSFFVGLFFSTLVPTGFFITAAVMIVGYWLDRWLLMRRWRYPPMYDGTMAKMAHRFYMIALYAHVWMSFWYFIKWPFNLRDAVDVLVGAGTDSESGGVALNISDANYTGAAYDTPDSWQAFTKPSGYISDLPQDLREGRGTYLRIYFVMMIFTTIVVIGEVFGVTVFEFVYSLLSNGPGVLGIHGDNAEQEAKHTTMAYDENGLFFQYDEIEDTVEHYTPQSRYHYSNDPQNQAFFMDLSQIAKGKDGKSGMSYPYKIDNKGNDEYILY